MGLIDRNIGQLIEPVNIKNIDGIQQISGVDISKQFISTRANLDGVDLDRYSVVPPKHFAANLMHIGRDIKLPVAYNSSSDDIIISPAYAVFKVKGDDIIDEYLYIIMNSSEFDRLTWFYTDSSIRGNLLWERFCSIQIKLPPIPVQQKAVDAYNALKANLAAYTDGLDDLKLTAQAYIEKLAKEYPLEEIGDYIEPCGEKNQDEKYELDAVKGISIQKCFIETKANMEDVSLKPYILVEPDAFAFVPTTSRNGEKITIAINQSNDTYIVSSSYEVFKIKDKEDLLPEYLFLWLSRTEFDRYTRFHSWGSAREVFTYANMCKVKIPIPSIEIQKSIVAIYNAQTERQQIAGRLNRILKDICPVLIRQSLEEIN
ncbi:MAG: restriction endonuclease subunit S [Paludibacter sp.]|nr:restriction endonuclease subunit S [Paludibacter sp.]